jgi:phosphatidylglycerol---prolipoprotein diacylglyceryl transferase
MILDFIKWNADPKIANLGALEVRWYGLFFALTFFLGYLIMAKMYKKEKIKIELLDKLTIYMFIGTLLGARLGHCLFYESEYYLANPLEILYVWEGGLASHGALIGILIVLFIFRYNNKMSVLWLLDRLVIVTALAAFFIRMGNLFNSEILGIQTDVPWAFIFERIDNVPRHPAQLYEAIFYLFVFVFLLLFYTKLKAQIKGGLFFGWFLVLIFGFRFFVEFIKESQVSFEDDMSLNMGQWLSIPAVITGLVMIYLSTKRKVEPAYISANQEIDKSEEESEPIQ